MSAVQKTILIPYEKYLRLIGRDTEPIETEPPREISAHRSDLVGNRGPSTEESLLKTIVPPKKEPVAVPSSEKTVLKRKRSYRENTGPPGIPYKTKVQKKSPAPVKWLKL